MAGGNCSCCCCCCIDTYKYTQCRHKHAHTPRRVAMLQGSCKKCSILMRTTSGAVCIGVRVRGCACMCNARSYCHCSCYSYCYILLLLLFYRCCNCFFFLLVNKQLCIMNLNKIQNYSQCERRTACTTLLNGLDVRYRT